MIMYIGTAPFLLNSFGEMYFLEESYEQMQKKNQILKFLKALSIWNHCEYALKYLCIAEYFVIYFSRWNIIYSFQDGLF